LAVALGASAPASAGTVKGQQLALYPAADSPSPNATGKVTLYGDTYLMTYDAVGFSVSKLAPNASYYMPVSVVLVRTHALIVINVPIQTDVHGKAENVLPSTQASPNGWYIPLQGPFQVYDASGTLMLTSSP
jgi:hypothetical protein